MSTPLRSLRRAATTAAALALTATAANAQQVIDAVLGGNPPGFTVDSGNWVTDTTVSGGYNQGQLIYFAPPGADPGSVTWTFTGLNTALSYDVAATWVLGNLAGNRSTDAQYTVTGATSTGPLIVSQIAAPTADHTAIDDFDNSFNFQTIATVMPNANGVITLNLADPTSGDVQFEHADAALVQAILNGDLNLDGFVGAADLDLLLADWGATDSIADADGNGTVGQGDLDIVTAQWGLGTPPANVPEPTSFALLSLAGLALLQRRRTA